jgi:hypothetical protein
MQRYLEQLLGDIAMAIEHEKNAASGKSYDQYDWKSEEEEE